MHSLLFGASQANISIAPRRGHMSEAEVDIDTLAERLPADTGTGTL